jgi:putative flippase GtrA
MLNARLNFLQKLSTSAGLRFFSVGLIGLALTTVSLNFLIVAGISALMAKVLVLPVLLVAQFFSNRAWTFREVRQETIREMLDAKEL